MFSCFFAANVFGLFCNVSKVSGLDSDDKSPPQPVVHLCNAKTLAQSRFIPCQKQRVLIDRLKAYAHTLWSLIGRCRSRDLNTGF